jgi:UDP:flavonoid glycosyltransferase YjiC (YdhE family)
MGTMDRKGTSVSGKEITSVGERRGKVLIMVPGVGAALGDVFPYLRIGEALLDAGHIVVLAIADPIRKRVEKTLGIIDERFELQRREVYASRRFTFLLKLPIGAPEFIVQFLNNALPESLAARDCLLSFLHSQPRLDVMIGKCLGSPEIQGKWGFSVLDLAISPNVAKKSGRVPFQLSLLGRVIARAVVVAKGGKWFPSKTAKPMMTLGLWSQTLSGEGAESGRFRACGFVSPPWPKNRAPLSDGLEEFLNDGEPPVAFVFGSQLHRFGVDRVIDIANYLAKRGGHRVVVAGVMEAPKSPARNRVIFVAPFVNLDVLLPGCCAVVSHAGIGTIGSAIRSGIPSIMFPKLFDQPYNAKLVERQGLGVALDLSTDFNGNAIKDALELVCDGAFLKNIREVSEKVNRECGIESVLRYVNELVGLRN